MQSASVVERPRLEMAGRPAACAESPALISHDGARSHGRLREEIRATAALLPDVATGKRLVHVPLRAEPERVVAYLAVLEAGHVALVTGTGSHAAAIAERYRPDLAITGDPAAPFTDWALEPQHLLHPDLALLLSTSGSTGSPKLVRLSHENVRSNAHAIAGALHLSARDRAITSLPLSYTFGLSVLHSHLVAGAAVVLHDGSVTDASFWRAVDRYGVTTLAAVPHTFDLLASAGELERPHPSLRQVAQAGGRLQPERVRQLARLGERCGWELAVMYGQTEATARICVLDPSLAAEAPDAVGTPVAATSIRLDTDVPEAEGGAGEVVVRGPGVMLGYAEHPDELALGPMIDELRTGDLGRIGADGQLRIVGRRGGFVKVMGLRIDVGAVERALEAEGLVACVGGDPDGLTVTVEPAGTGTGARARRAAGDASGLGAAAVAVAVAPLPRLPHGKVDRPAAAALARSAAAAPEPTGADRIVEVARAIGRVLAIDDVDPRRSFVELGGDSLSHVQASVRLEALIGQLPAGWHHRPLDELAALAPSQRRPRRRGRVVETTVLLRAVAAVAICGSHAGLFDVQGFAHILLGVAGASTARFALSAPTAPGRWRAILRMLIGVTVPASAIALLGMLTTGRYDWSNVLHGHWLTAAPGDPATLVEFWFVEVLLACIVVFALVRSLPALGGAWQRHPWRVAAVLTALALVARVVMPLVTDEPQGTLPGSLWLFAAGVAAAHADTWPRRAATLALAVLGGATFFPDDPARSATIVGGIAALVLLSHVRLPSWIVPPLAVLAAASLHIYLLQFLVLSLLEPDALETAAAIAAGIALWLVVDRPVRRLQAVAARLIRPRATEHPRVHASAPPIVRSEIAPMPIHRTPLVALLAVTLALTACTGGQDDVYTPQEDTLQIYSAQHIEITEALAEAFTDESGIATQVRDGQDASMGHMIVQEGDASPADVFLTENSPAMTTVERAGLLAPVAAPTLESVRDGLVPSSGLWAPIAARSTVLIYNTEEITEAELPDSIMDLADPEWAGRWGGAPGGADFQAIVAGMLAERGEQETLAWLEALVDGAEIYQNNIATMEAVSSGEVPVGIMYHYYWYRDRAGDGQASENTALRYFGGEDPGAFVSLSAGGVLAASDMPEDAQRFLAFVTSREGQQVLVDSGALEYAVGEGVDSDPALPPLDSLEAPAVDPSVLNSDGVIALMTDAGIL